MSVLGPAGDASTTRCPATPPVRRNSGRSCCSSGTARVGRIYARPRLGRRRPPSAADITAVRAPAARTRAAGGVRVGARDHPGPAGRGPLGRAGGAGGAADGARPGRAARRRTRCPTYRCGCSTRRPGPSPADLAARRAVAAGRIRRRRHRPGRRRPGRAGRRVRRPDRRRGGDRTGPASAPAAGSRRWPNCPATAPWPAARRCGSARSRRSPGWPPCRRPAAAASARRSPPRWPAGCCAAGVELVFLSAGSEDIARVYLRVGFRRVGTACIAEPAAVLG